MDPKGTMWCLLLLMGVQSHWSTCHWQALGSQFSFGQFHFCPSGKSWVAAVEEGIWVPQEYDSDDLQRPAVTETGTAQELLVYPDMCPSVTVLSGWGFIIDLQRHTCTDTYICICTCLYMCAHMHINIHIHAYTHTSVCVF